MRRSRLETLLHDYVAGDLDATQTSLVRALLERDAAARALCDEIRNMHDALVTLRERPAPQTSAEDAWVAIRKTVATDAFRGKPVLALQSEGTRYYRRLALAASLLCALAIGLFVTDRLADDPAAPTTPKFSDRPTASERGLQPFVDAGRRTDGIDALEFKRMLERSGLNPSELFVTPRDNIVPVSSPIESR